MLSDFEIRDKLIHQLHIENKNKEYRIIEELAICDSLARADIAVANGKFHGFEIKSDCDSLERLKNQVVYYDNTFDTNTIVVGLKFKDKITKHVPEHWGVQYAYLNRFGNVTIKKIRTARINKEVDAHSILDLLWGSEIKMLLKKNNIKGYSKKRKQGLKEMTTNSIPLKILKEYTRETLKTRRGWRDDLL